MADSTNSRITIADAPTAIMEIIADVEKYPEWISGIEDVTVLDRDQEGRPLSATFVGNLGMVKDSYTLGYDWSDSEVSWHLEKGEKLTAMDGRYSCSENADGTTDVVYELSVDLAIPVVGMLRRRGEKVIVDSALKGLKRRVEG